MIIRMLIQDFIYFLKQNLPCFWLVPVSFPLVKACFADRKNFAKFFYWIIFLKLTFKILLLKLKDIFKFAAGSYFLRSFTKKLIASFRISFASFSSAISFISCFSRSVNGSEDTFCLSFRIVFLLFRQSMSLPVLNFLKMPAKNFRF